MESAVSLCRRSEDCDLYAFEDWRGGWFFYIARTGEMFIEHSRDAARTRLRTLRADGVRFPDEAFAILEEED